MTSGGDVRRSCRITAELLTRDDHQQKELILDRHNKLIHVQHNELMQTQRNKLT